MCKTASECVSFTLHKVPKCLKHSQKPRRLTLRDRATFDNPGWHACPDKKFVVGFYRNSCDELYCLEEFKCGTFA